MHVLSTPPAFILSQDQTLMLWSEFRRNLLLRVTSAKRNFSCDTSRFPVKSLFRWNDFSVRAHPRSGSLMRAHPVLFSKTSLFSGIYFSVSLPRSGTFHVTRPVIPSKSSIWITYPGQINLAIAVNLWLIANQKFSFLIYCLRFRSLKELTYGNFLPCMLNLSRFFTVQLSRYCICTRLFIRYIRRRILLILCCPLSHDSSYIIASCFAFVNNFLNYLKSYKLSSCGQIVYNSTMQMGCQQLFYIFRFFPHCSCYSLLY